MKFPSFGVGLCRKFVVSVHHLVAAYHASVPGAAQRVRRTVRKHATRRVRYPACAPSHAPSAPCRHRHRHRHRHIVIVIIRASESERQKERERERERSRNIQSQRHRKPKTATAKRGCSTYRDSPRPTSRQLHGRWRSKDHACQRLRSSTPHVTSVPASRHDSHCRAPHSTLVGSRESVPGIAQQARREASEPGSARTLSATFEDPAQWLSGCNEPVEPHGEP
eukprot:3589491-Rhodomonas_salina.1